MMRGIWICAAGAALLAVSGCKSYWIDATVENQTGKAVRELEIDYPTASFGTNSIATGGTLHYRLQIRGSGPIKVEYTFGDGTTVHAQGRILAEHQQGLLTVKLFPQGKVEFMPHLEPAS